MSYSARAEDVVLHRALGTCSPAPRYAVVGGAGLRALDEHGWTRSDLPAPDDEPLHAVVVRTEPDDHRSVLAAHPWVVVAPGRADARLVRALVEERYLVTQYDGASTFLVRADRAEALVPLLDHPAQPGEHVTAEVVALQAEARAWQEKSLEPWSVAAATEITAGRAGGAEALARELDAIRSTLSWRVTAPLRVLRRRQTGR